MIHADEGHPMHHEALTCNTPGGPQALGGQAVGGQDEDMGYTDDQRWWLWRVERRRRTNRGRLIMSLAHRRSRPSVESGTR